MTGRSVRNNLGLAAVVALLAVAFASPSAHAQNGSLLAQGSQGNGSNSADRYGGATGSTRQGYSSQQRSSQPGSSQPGVNGGQSSSRRPLSLANNSWTYQAPEEPKVWKLNDQVTVLIEEKAQMKSEGQVDQRKKVEGAMALTEWLTLDGWSIVPDPQSAGDPKIAGIVDNKYRAQANLKNNDLFQTKIHCTVVDIRPNGLLVIEGHDKVQIDEEQWELSFSGIINPDDILPDARSIKSEKVSEKRVLRRSAGHGRDGIRRGWLGRFLDKYQPF